MRVKSPDESGVNDSLVLNVTLISELGWCEDMNYIFFRMN